MPACEHNTIFDFIVIYPYLDVYPHILQYFFFVVVAAAAFSSSFVSFHRSLHTHPHSHCFIAFHAHKYFRLSHSPFPLLLFTPVWHFGVPHSVFFSVFTVNVYIFLLPHSLLRFPFLGIPYVLLFTHSLFLSLSCSVCLCNVYGYCNVFVGACLDNFPQAFVILFLSFLFFSVGFFSLFLLFYFVLVSLLLQWFRFVMLCNLQKPRLACARQINKIP